MPTIHNVMARIPHGVRTRFAPSPTGYLHLGHVVNAVYVWGVARAVGGTVVVRMEDHDRQRCRPEYEAAILDELEWLGFHADEGLTTANRHRPSDFRQSDCAQRYNAALRHLEQNKLIYPCSCSRRDLHAAAPVGDPPPGAELPYPGWCRTGLRNPQNDTLLRVRVPADTVSFSDLLLGSQEQTPANQCGDFSLRDRHAQWTYHFACICDDIAQRVNLVVRGQDLLFSTGRQILLARLLGRPQTPLFLHHPLIRDKTGRKLSKRRFSESVSQLRERGINPDEVIGEAVYRCGLTPHPAPLSAPEAVARFPDWALVPTV